MNGQILLVDKPAGMTSHDVVDQVRRIFGIRRVGHAGTLDPFATGLLIIGIGPATKELANYSGLDKTYVATARLGATSTTDDPEGEIVESQKSEVKSQEQIEKVLDEFRGGYEQTASAYSAKKINGKKLYQLARRGKLEGVELPKKNVTISDLHILNFAWPDLEVEVTCSSGTYVRSLARDIGEKLGCGAYLTALRRISIGDFNVREAKKLQNLAK